MRAVEVLLGFLPLLVFGGLLVGLIRVVRRGQAKHPTDPAQVTRQAAIYGTLLLTMFLSAMGAVWAYHELTTSIVWRNNGDLAGALALVAVGFPTFTVLLVAVDRRLGSDESERSSFAWTTYLVVGSISALIATMIGAFHVLSSLVDPADDIAGRDVMMVVVWGAFFAAHWTYLRVRHGIETDAHLSLGTVVGFVPLFIGQVGVAAVLADRVYDAIFDRAASDLRDTSAPWAALFVVGAVVWLGVWLRQYEAAPRTELWYVAVLPIGTLVGYVVMLGAIARLGYLGVSFVIGDASNTSAQEHFDGVPTMLALGATGAISWRYHGWLVTSEHVRSEAIRSYDYLLLAASLVTGVVGAVVVVSALFDDPFSRNPLLAGLTLLATGGLAWSERALYVAQHENDKLDPEGSSEIASWVRRNYLFGTLGVGGLAVLFAGIVAMEGLFEDTLEGRLGFASLIDTRVELAIVGVVGLVLWLHARVLRRDAAERDAVAQAPPKDAWPSRIVVLGDSHVLPIDLREHADTSIEYWHRTDGAQRLASLVDMDLLNDALVEQTGDDVLVLLNDGTTTVIPFER